MLVNSVRNSLCHAVRGVSSHMTATFSRRKLTYFYTVTSLVFMLGSYLVEKGRTRMFSHNIVFSEFSINAVLGTLLSSVSVKKQSIHGLKVLGKNLAIGAITVPVTAIAVKTLFPNRKLDLKLTAITHSIIGFYGVAHRPVPMLMGGADAVASNSG
ncbi:MAG: hypothetical protein L7U87_00560 [Chlamydiales bacterium]|nr:hypothetical protein [Chlamydiales bacterium]